MVIQQCYYNVETIVFLVNIWTWSKITGQTGLFDDQQQQCSRMVHKVVRADE